MVAGVADKGGEHVFVLKTNGGKVKLKSDS